MANVLLSGVCAMSSKHMCNADRTGFPTDGPVAHLLCDDVTAHRVVYHVVLVVQVLDAAQGDAWQGPQVLLPLQICAGLQQGRRNAALSGQLQQRLGRLCQWRNDFSALAAADNTKL
jgi:hypothetical protein